MPTALALSPHLDDAVFSAGGTLARLAREGWRVVVATVFAASVADPQGFALACQLDKGLPPDVDYMALRRAEDAAACRRLGAAARWLPFAEAPHRGYGSAQALFGPLRGDDRILGQLAPALDALRREVAPDLVLAPQAIGAHVDHVAVVLALQPWADDVRWWTDHPYSARPAPRPSPFADRFEALAIRRIDLEAADVCRKQDAVACYQSQLGFQFGGPDAARTHVAAQGRTESFRHRLRGFGADHLA